MNRLINPQRTQGKNADDQDVHFDNFLWSNAGLMTIVSTRMLQVTPCKWTREMMQSEARRHEYLEVRIQKVCPLNLS